MNSYNLTAEELKNYNSCCNELSKFHFTIAELCGTKIDKEQLHYVHTAIDSIVNLFPFRTKDGKKLRPRSGWSYFPMLMNDDDDDQASTTVANSINDTISVITELFACEQDNRTADSLKTIHSSLNKFYHINFNALTADIKVIRNTARRNTQIGIDNTLRLIREKALAFLHEDADIEISNLVTWIKRQISVCGLMFETLQEIGKGRLPNKCRNDIDQS
jgi:hypothetical protein